MKRKILERIQQLGGDIEGVEGKSLKEDLESITFNTVLYPKPTDTPWAKADDTEPIYGLENFVNARQKLYESDIDAFYTQVMDHFYQMTEEPHGQIFYKSERFTPFKEGTATFEEWNGEWEENDFKKVIDGKEMDLMFIGESYGFPDHLFICLTDPNPENPMVYGTDHEQFFDEISKEGTLEDFFNSCMTKKELLQILKDKLKSNPPNKDRITEPTAEEQRLKEIQKNGSLEDIFSTFMSEEEMDDVFGEKPEQ